MTNPPPGWHHDPQHPGRLRWWDGQRWTEHVQDAAPTPPSPQQPQQRQGPRRDPAYMIWLVGTGVVFALIIVVQLLRF